MLDSSLREELLKALDRLSPAMQLRVLDFARTLRESTLRGTPDKELLRFAGTVTPAEADEFLRGIEEDCEQIDPREW
jgi:hypothetical protein